MCQVMSEGRVHDASDTRVHCWGLDLLVAELAHNGANPTTDAIEVRYLLRAHPELFERVGQYYRMGWFIEEALKRIDAIEELELGDVGSGQPSPTQWERLGEVPW